MAEQNMRPKNSSILVLSIEIFLWFIFALLFFVFLGMLIVSGPRSIAGILGLGYLALSVRAVEADELATIKFFGLPLYSVSSGPHVVLFILFSIQRDPSTEIQLEIGSPSRNQQGVALESVNETDATDPTKYRIIDPMRITFASKKSTENELGGNIITTQFEDGEPLDSRQTSDPHVTLIWRIENHPVFISRVGSLAAGNEIIRKAAMSALQSLAQRFTLARAMRLHVAIETALTFAIEIRLGERSLESPEAQAFISVLPPKETPGQERYRYLGIDFGSAQINTWGTSKRVNEAFVEARKTEITGQAEHVKRREEGEGTAEALEALRTAEANGRHALVEASDSDIGKFLAQLEVVRDTAKVGDKWILVSPEILEALRGVTGAALKKRET